MPDPRKGTDPPARFDRAHRGGPDNDQDDAPRRLGELRRTQPADATTKNLLALLTAKLELCAGLPVWEWEAGNEGHRERAASFRALAAEERRSCIDIMEWLREHLELTAETNR